MVEITLQRNKMKNRIDAAIEADYEENIEYFRSLLNDLLESVEENQVSTRYGFVDFYHIVKPQMSLKRLLQVTCGELAKDRDSDFHGFAEEIQETVALSVPEEILDNISDEDQDLIDSWCQRIATYILEQDEQINARWYKIYNATLFKKLQTTIVTKIIVEENFPRCESSHLLYVRNEPLINMLNSAIIQTIF